jgi:ADP-ribosyl-[dinitrogen reductase] hydrolase
MDETDRIQDRAIGAFLGLAIGDALGTTLEFSRRDTYLPLTDMVGGGPFQLEPGQWTDDTAMALALAESLLACGKLDESDLLDRFVSWYKTGEYSCTGTCFDIGNTTRDALENWIHNRNVDSGSTNPQTAGNGSLMRLSPVALRYWRNRDILIDIAARQSKTTHGAEQAVQSCMVFAELLGQLIAGRNLESSLHNVKPHYREQILCILSRSWLDTSRSDIKSSGYVMHSLEAALWCLHQTNNFKDAVLLAANLGDDADTTAAITGQLAGALYGAYSIPDEWIAKLAMEPRLRQIARELYQLSLAD